MDFTFKLPFSKRPLPGKACFFFFFFLGGGGGKNFTTFLASIIYIQLLYCISSLEFLGNFVFICKLNLRQLLIAGLFCTHTILSKNIFWYFQNNIGSSYARAYAERDFLWTKVEEITKWPKFNRNSPKIWQIFFKIWYFVYLHANHKIIFVCFLNYIHKSDF